MNKLSPLTNSHNHQPYLLAFLVWIFKVALIFYKILVIAHDAWICTAGLNFFPPAV